MKTYTTSCRLCGCQTIMLGTKLCDRCWELETRIKRDPDLARKILNGIDGTPTQPEWLSQSLNEGDGTYRP